MIIIQETATLPKLSQTSLYRKFDQTSDLSKTIVAEIKKSKDYIVTPDSIKELLSLIKLNGDAIAKKAVDAYTKGDIIIIFNKETSQIPQSLPYLVVTPGGKSTKAYIFADKYINKITSATEYSSLMALMEAAYLAMKLQTEPDTFLMNSQLMLTLCSLYTFLVTTPLEQKLYMKGENLTKAMAYTITYFYKMIRGEDVTTESIPFKRLLQDKMDPNTLSQIVDDVKTNPDGSFMGLIKMIMKLNPLRYKNLDSMYMTYFVPACGTSLIFALENIQYLFLLLTSASYKCQITSYSLNKAVSMYAKKAVTLLTASV